MMVLEDSPTTHFLRDLPQRFEKPKAILIVSAHWETLTPSITGALTPPTIHDYYGFPPALYKLQYNAKGDPALAQRIKELLLNKGIEGKIDVKRGLDHGAWNPLMCMYPHADIPVVQLSVQMNETAQWHYAIGGALLSLRDEGVLIITSGNLTHNLHAAFRGTEPGVPEWVTRFSEWVWQKTSAKEYSALLEWKEQAPHAQQNHPTPEHFLPFFVALGAAGQSRPERLNQHVEMNVLAMDAYLFTD